MTHTRSKLASANGAGGGTYSRHFQGHRENTTTPVKLVGELFQKKIPLDFKRRCLRTATKEDFGYWWEVSGT
jgi:hypothetical protein